LSLRGEVPPGGEGELSAVHPKREGALRALSAGLFIFRAIISAKVYEAVYHKGERESKIARTTRIFIRPPRIHRAAAQKGERFFSGLSPATRRVTVLSASSRRAEEDEKDGREKEEASILLFARGFLPSSRGSARILGLLAAIIRRIKSRELMDRRSSPR